MKDKFKTLYNLRYYIFGIPKLYSNILVGLNLVWLMGYLILSIQKVFIEKSDYWTYKFVLILTFLSAIFLLVYYLIKTRYKNTKVKNIKSYLSILLNIFKLTFFTSNILVLLNYDTVSSNYELLILIFSSIYITNILISILVSLVRIVIRLINFRKYIPCLKNKEVVEFLSKDAALSLNES